jgi:hypothetical protein
MMTRQKQAKKMNGNRVYTSNVFILGESFFEENYAVENPSMTN